MGLFDRNDQSFGPDYDPTCWMPGDLYSFETWKKMRSGAYGSSGQPRDDPEWNNYYCGVDLGKRVDHSACVILQLKVAPNGAHHLDAVYLKRWRLDISYRAIASKLAKIDSQLHGKAAAQGKKCDPVWILDRGGVGDSVCELVSENMGPNAEVWQAILTGGRGDANIDYRGRVIKLPKVEMVSAISAALDAERLHFSSKKSPMLEATIQELQDFEVTVSESSGHESWNAKTGRHDDLVVALGLSTFTALTLGTRSIEMW